MDWEVVKYILDTLLVIGITFFAGFFAWESSKMVSEQKKNKRNPDLGRGKFDKQRVEYRDGDNT